MMKRDIRKQVSAIKMEEEDQRTNSNCEAVAAIVYLCEFWHHGLSHAKAIIELLLVTLSCHEIFDRWTFLSFSCTFHQTQCHGQLPPCPRFHLSHRLHLNHFHQGGPCLLHCLDLHLILSHPTMNYGLHFSLQL